MEIQDKNKDKNKELEKKFLLPGGQRFYFKVSDLVKIINEKKKVVDNDPKPVTIEYGVHSVYSLSGSTGQGRGMNGMYFGDNRLTKLEDVGSTIDEEGQKGSLICFDTFALGQGGSGAKDNVPHDIYNAGFRITIGEKLICLKSFVVKDENGNYSLGLYYVGDDDGDWKKDVSDNVSDSQFAFPIYWDQDEAKRTISSDHLSKAKVNLQIIGKEGLEISEAKIKESQAITEYFQTDTDNEGNKLFLFAESDKYLYKEEDIPTDKDNNKKSGPTSWLKFVGKFVPIPVLIFFLVFFVIKVAIAYAIIYTVLSIITELVVYRMFFHKNRSKKNRNIVKSIKTLKPNEKEGSIRDKIENSMEFKQKVEGLSWQYGKIEFSKFNGNDDNRVIICKYKNDDIGIVYLQYCLYTPEETSKDKLRCIEGRECCRGDTMFFNGGIQLEIGTSDKSILLLGKDGCENTNLEMEEVDCKLQQKMDADFKKNLGILQALIE